MLESTDECLVIRALWAVGNKPMQLGYTVFEPGDTFIERYYPRKWFSIWEVQSHRNGRTKGWYCNVCQPIEMDGDSIRFIDMELDVFLYPDGRFVVLDEDELDGAGLAASEQQAARAGLDEVLDWIRSRRFPFERIGPPRQVLPFWDPPPPRH